MTVLSDISKKFSDAVLNTDSFRGDDIIVIDKYAARRILSVLKSDIAYDFNLLMDLTAVDYSWMHRKPRFEVVYHLYSLTKKRRLRVKAGVEEYEPVIDSVVPLWACANWFEREVWDMFGIKFEGHPDLTRILMYEAFLGHPLRKDYPVNQRQPLIGPKN